MINSKTSPEIKARLLLVGAAPRALTSDFFSHDGTMRTESSGTEMFLQQFQRELVVALCERAIAHHVGKHNGREFPLLSLGAHLSRPTFFNNAWKRGSFRTLS